MNIKYWKKIKKIINDYQNHFGVMIDEIVIILVVQYYIMQVEKVKM
jgi:hypothetical protein